MKSPSKLQVPPEVSRAMRKTEREVAELSAAAVRAMGGGDEPIRFTLELGDELFFEFGSRAMFRMGTAARPFELTDIADPKRSYAAAVTWLWACLSEQDAERFQEPENLSAMIPFSRMAECAKAFIKAVTDYNAAHKSAAKPAAT